MTISLQSRTDKYKTEKYFMQIRLQISLGRHRPKNLPADIEKQSVNSRTP